MKLAQHSAFAFCHPSAPALSRSQLRGVTLHNTSPTKSEIPALCSQLLADNSFTLFHSLQNKSFICTLFTKTPRGTHPPAKKPRFLLESAVKKIPSVTPLSSAVTKKGVGAPAAKSSPPSPIQALRVFVTSLRHYFIASSL